MRLPLPLMVTKAMALDRRIARGRRGVVNLRGGMRLELRKGRGRLTLVNSRVGGVARTNSRVVIQIWSSRKRMVARGNISLACHRILHLNILLETEEKIKHFPHILRIQQHHS